MVVATEVARVAAERAVETEAAVKAAVGKVAETAAAEKAAETAEVVMAVSAAKVAAAAAKVAAAAAAEAEVVVVEGRRSAALELRRRWNERGAARGGGGGGEEWGEEAEEGEKEEARLPPHSLSSQGDMAEMLQWARKLRDVSEWILPEAPPPPLKEEQAARRRREAEERSDAAEAARYAQRSEQLYATLCTDNAMDRIVARETRQAASMTGPAAAAADTAHRTALAAAVAAAEEAREVVAGRERAAKAAQAVRQQSHLQRLKRIQSSHSSGYLAARGPRPPGTAAVAAGQQAALGLAAVRRAPPVRPASAPGPAWRAAPVAAGIERLPGERPERAGRRSAADDHAVEPRFKCHRFVRVIQAGFSERPRDAARARRAQLRENISLRSDLEQSRRHIVTHRYEGEYRCEERRHRAALSPPPRVTSYLRHDLSTSLAELKPSIFDQYPVGVSSPSHRYSPSRADRQAPSRGVLRLE